MVFWFCFNLWRQDPERNRIAQWLNVKPDHGIVQLFFQLPSEPSLGTYTISVDNKAFMNFDVKEYGWYDGVAISLGELGHRVSKK